MKIHIYTDIHELFGPAAMAWMNDLLSCGHDVEYVDIGIGTDQLLPNVGACDVNLLVAGVFAFKRFKNCGFPKHGRNVLWMFDPLTRDDSSEHRYKAGLFDALAPGLHAVACMDDRILKYLSAHYPQLPAVRIPYLIAPATIATPDAGSQRNTPALWLGADNARRRHAAQLFKSAGVPARFMFEHVWGAARDRMRKDSRIMLSVHADAHHTYFDQFRAFEAWAAGCAVVAEESDDIAALGIESGVHLVMTPLEQMPTMCRKLLDDEPRRQAMVDAAQDLLRREFSPARWRDEMFRLMRRALTS